MKGGHAPKYRNGTKSANCKIAKGKHVAFKSLRGAAAVAAADLWNFRSMKTKCQVVLGATRL